MMYVCVCEFHMNERMRWLQDGIHGLPCEAAHASRSLGLLSLWQEQARTDCEGTRNISMNFGHRKTKSSKSTFQDAEVSVGATYPNTTVPERH